MTAPTPNDLKWYCYAIGSVVQNTDQYDCVIGHTFFGEMTKGNNMNKFLRLEGVFGQQIASTPMHWNIDDDSDARVEWQRQQRQQQQQKAKQLAAEQLAAEQLAAEQLAAEQLAAEQLAAEQLAAEQLAAEQLAADILLKLKRRLTKKARIKAEKEAVQEATQQAARKVVQEAAKLRRQNKRGKK
jgi:hypothetical protein